MKIAYVILVIASQGICGEDRPKVMPKLTWGSEEYLQGGYATLPWIADPFRKEREDFRFSAIISNEMAFINTKWVRVGDKLGDYVVKAIGNGEVDLEKGEKTLILKLERDK